LGNRSHRRFRKFYQSQVEEIIVLLDRHYKEGQLSLDAYFEICEQKGIEPDLDEMPPTIEDYPSEVQVAFLLHNLLPDRWDGMSGSYMGKDYSSLALLLDTWEVENKKDCIFWIKNIEARNAEQLNKELEKKRKSREAQAKSKGKSGINIQG